MKRITFDDNSRKFVLEALGKHIDDEGYIVETSSDQRVYTTGGETLLGKDLGAVTKGSEIFIKSDLISLMKLADTCQRM